MINNYYCHLLEDENKENIKSDISNKKQLLLNLILSMINNYHVYQRLFNSLSAWSLERPTNEVNAIWAIPLLITSEIKESFFASVPAAGIDEIIIPASTVGL